MRIASLIAALLALAAVTVPAMSAPAGWSRPGGYYDQVKAGSLSKPVDACRIDPVTETCVKPKPVPTV